jgi:uncharacterized protein with HEPN domain
MRRDEACLLDILLAARRALIGNRNRLILEYFRINHETVWVTIKNDLPDLIQMIEPFIPKE